MEFHTFYLEQFRDNIFNRNGTVDISFNVGENAVAFRCFRLLDQYLFIVRVFDRCLDGKLFANANICRSARKVIDRFKELLVLEGHTEQAKMVERGWIFLPTDTDA